MNKQPQRLISVLAFCLLAGAITFTGCKVSQVTIPTAIPTLTPTLVPAPTVDNSEYMQVFESVSSTTLESSSLLQTPISIASSPGLPPVIDGTVTPGEWDGAEQELFSDGSELFMVRSGEYLYLGIRATTPGMIVGNVFVEQNNQVTILHASAALGTAIYQKGTGTWQQSQDFSWSCRKTGNSEAALAERAEFLQTEGWIASNSRMGKPNELEYQIKINGSPLHLAVIFLRADDPDVKIPWPPDLDDDCIKPTEGGFPSNMVFSLEQWGMLIFPDIGG